MQPPKKSSAGFSLIEIIVILVVAGFLGVLVVNLMGTQLTKSGVPLMTTQNAASAESVMENVVAYYTTRVNTNLSTALDDVKANTYANPANATIAFTTTNFNGVPVVVVTVTAGSNSLSTVLTQERNNAADDPVTY